MMWKLAIMIIVLVASVLTVPNFFKFSNQSPNTGSAPTNNENIATDAEQVSDSAGNVVGSSSQSVLTSTGVANPLKLPFGWNPDPKSWLDNINKLLWDAINKFSSYITSYFGKIFPKMSTNFGLLFFLLIILFFAWLLSSKFEHIFKSLILVAVLICFVLLIMSAIGFF